MTAPAAAQPACDTAMKAGPLPFVSVIVPVRNEEAVIRGTLEQLLHQDYDRARFEILVADGQRRIRAAWREESRAATIRAPLARRKTERREPRGHGCGISREVSGQTAHL